MSLKTPISITAIASISALGECSDQIWKNYLNDNSFLVEKKFQNTSAIVGELSKKTLKEIDLLKSNTTFKRLDPSVLYAIYVSRKAIQQSNWDKRTNFGVNIGSSRGATQLFEQYYSTYLKNKRSDVLCSPTTTLGNISSWVAQDLQNNGPEISHSITCSTALHSLLNGIAWINSGLTSKFLVGGSEAPLTEFTISQMQALKIYSSSKNKTYPCQSLNLNKEYNSMILGEGAAVACLEEGSVKNSIGKIIGIGYATEKLNHHVSISETGECLKKSMKMALENTSLDEIDCIVMHAPGTIKGDLSEVNAIKTIFKNKTPFLTTNKWKIGHTLGTSGMLSIHLALLMMQHQKAIVVPFIKSQQQPKNINNILVNAVGFGGNAVSILISK